MSKILATQMKLSRIGLAGSYWHKIWVTNVSKSIHNVLAVGQSWANRVRKCNLARLRICRINEYTN